MCSPQTIDLFAFCLNWFPFKNLILPSEWEKIIATGKELTSKIYKQLMQLNTRKINDQFKKWAKKLNSISPEKTYRWLTNTWKDGQHHSSNKCKSKPQWGTTLIRMATIKKSTNNKCWRGCGENGTLLHCWWECKLVQPLWRTVWRFLKKLEIELPYDSAIPLLGIHTEETRSERDMCTPVFIAALFIIARTWKQPVYIGRWMDKKAVVHTHNGMLLGNKKNAFESVLMRWIKLEPPEWSKSERETPIQHVNAYIWDLERW